MTEEVKTSETLEQLKKVFATCQVKLRCLDSPREELQSLAQIINDAVATNYMEKDPAFTEFINKEVAIGIMQKLAKTMSYDQAYLEIVADTMQSFIDYFCHEMKQGRYNEQFTCAMTWCFQPSNNLFVKNFLITDEELKKLKTLRQTWRAELKMGDFIDVHADADMKKKCQGWVQAQIVRVDGDVLSLEFPKLPAAFDCDLDRWSTEIAQFESKSKEDYAWRDANMTNLDLVDYIVDCNDTFKWEESTIFNIYEDNSDGRTVLMANCGFRVYRSEGKKLRTDERGVFDGWSSKYDENIPVYSPRVQIHLSRVNQITQDEEDSDEELDDLVQPEEGHDQVYLVPRISSCICARFLQFMNKFGHEGGFQAILDALNKQPDENLTLTTMGYMITMISMPSKLFHRVWINEHGAKFAAAMKKQLLDSQDGVLKSVSQNDVDQIQISINSINARIMDREEVKKQGEIMKLEVTTKCLSSTLLERRILGIKQLNTIIRNNKLYGTKVFTMQQLIEWMKEQEIFDILWDPKRTHLQLVQRSNEIFKILPREGLLTMELLQQFWNLSKSDYKTEVFKIINDTAFDLQGEHIEYLFDQITETPSNKLGMEEFDALSNLGKFAKSTDFQQRTSEFFWKIIVNSDDHKQELIDNCIKKFSDMIKYWTMEKKEHYFDKLTEHLKNTSSSAVPIIRLFKKIIADQKSKDNTYSSSSNQYNTTVVNHGATTNTAYGKTIYSKSYQPTSGGQNNQESIYEGEEEEDKTNDESKDKEITLTSVLNNLYQKHGFVESLMNNLKAYCEAAAAKIGQDASLLTRERSKMFVINPQHSHHDEVHERLSFFQEFAVNSDFQISKAQLQVIYDLLTQSPVQSDFTEFLTWCSAACAAQTVLVSVLDLTEVGEFFSELIRTKNLNLKQLPVVGFEFLKMYFTSQNLEQEKVSKVASPEKKKPINTGWSTGFYSSSMKKEDDEVVQSDDDPTIKVNVDPSELTKIDMIWEIALESQDEEVINKSISFLVNCYLSLGETLEEKRNEFLQALNSRCFELIAANKTNPDLIKRLIRVLKYVIQISEKKGTASVQPHNAILKGEALDRIIIRYMVKNKQSYYNSLKLDKSIVVKIYTSATVWDFKKEVSAMLGLSPKYIKLTLANKDIITDSQHGMTLQQLSLRNGDILTAEKLSIVENIIEAPLVDRVNRTLTQRAKEIFTEWYYLYKDIHAETMDAVHLAAFIAGATKQSCLKDDNRVEHILNKYDSDKDGAITLPEFLMFYYDAAAGGSNIKAVQQNLKNHNVRLDLKKISELVEEVAFNQNEMPRYTLSANQEQFNALFNLLDRNDETSQDVWSLVRMLATNQQMYEEVLSLSQAKTDSGMISWEGVFEDASLYKQIYKQEIIVAVMEASNTGSLKRVMFVEEQKIAANYVPSSMGTSTQQAGGAEESKEAAPQDSTQDSTQAEEETEESKHANELKSNWTKQFLEQQGFNYILTSFLNKEVTASDASSFSEQASLKDVGFLLTLLRVFLQAGFVSSNGDISQAIQLVRKSSSINDNDEVSQKKQQTEQDFLVSLMNSPEGQAVTLETDFDQLLSKVLSIMAIILSKTTQILEDKIILENALAVFVGILLFKPELYAKFATFQKADGQIKTAEDLVFNGILCNEEKVRIDFEMSLKALANTLNTGDHNILYFLLQLLAKRFADISNKPSMQFFELFNFLIDTKARQDALNGNAADESTAAIYDPNDLLNQIIDKIKQQQHIKNEAAASENVDEVKALEDAAEQERLLVGLITLTGKIIAKADKAVSDRIIQEKDLIGQIFREFLFVSYYQAKEKGDAESDVIRIVQQVGSRTDKKHVAAPNNKSREAAYELLHQLIKNSTTLMKGFLDSQLLPLIQTIKKPKTWNYAPQTTLERHQKYVGLRNLGCICYMNSMMQQFFMIPALRYNLLCVDDNKPEAMAAYKGEQIDDNMLHQMQKLVAHLELSERNEFNPMQFCFAFKEFDGAPTNTAEQKDAQEFLNLIFDRLENGLKETSRKHLVNGVFGGKLCSQMVCTECGKVKNRSEDYLNLTLPVKGVKSIEESLAKQVEGEIISDYQCDGCNRKVDLSKRTLIASTPNVLIVHLQRICFNFETFQNDKINTFCSFPNMLDLKPYSFHEVMGKENRLLEQQDEDANQNQQDEKNMTEEEIADKREREDEAREPERDDCYEYKLVGVNVHSGTANAGHYWSYINTNRGVDEEKDPNWMRTEADTWMEYNDSRVSDWEFSELRQRTFGNENKGSSGGNQYFSSMGDSYGTSAYMLFYERKVKKDFMIRVEDAEVEAEKAKGVEVQFDEAKKEHFKMLPYRTAAEGEVANDIYKKVAEDNMKFTFESDIYSTEFFEFILQILNSVAETEVDDDTKINGLQIGSKVGFEILARMFNNPGIDKVSDVLIEILKSRPQITKPFVAALIEDGPASYIWEVMLECGDKNAQKVLGKVLNYAICQLKMQEKDLALSQETEMIETIFTDTDGKEHKQGVAQPKAVCVRFVMQMIELLPQRAAKSWRKFDHFMDIFYAMMVYSPEDIELDRTKHDESSEAFKVGTELFFKYEMIHHLGDFILQENSPYNEVGQIRQQMGGTYGSPNFSAILKLIIIMVSSKELSAKYPLNENDQTIVSHKDILQKMIEPGEGANATDFGDVLVNMARDNTKISKKMARSYLKSVNKTGIESLMGALTQIKEFLKIDDSLKMQRLEWIMGIPQVISKPNYRTKQQQHGYELIDLISDEYIQYKSGCVKGITDAFLGQLFKAKGRMETQCVVGLKNLVEMCLEDQDVAKFIYHCPSPSLQFARYSDWFFIYARQIKVTTMNQINNSATTLLEYHRKRLDALDYILSNEEKLEEIFGQWKNEQMAALEKVPADQFVGLADQTLANVVDEVIPSYPPVYIVGPTDAETEHKVILEKDTELATVSLVEVSVEYMYSNPQGIFNLSASEKMWRNPMYSNVSYNSWKLEQLRKEAKEQNTEVDNEDIVQKNWKNDHLVAPTILKVMIKSKASKMIRVGVKLSVTDNENKNVNFPLTEMKESLFSQDQKQAFVFMKIDPSRATWGDIDCELVVKAGKTSQISTSSTGTGSYSYGTGGYTNIGVGTSTSYKPKGVDGSTAIACINCSAECYLGETFCSKCGKSVTEIEENYY